MNSSLEYVDLSVNWNELEKLLLSALLQLETASKATTLPDELDYDLGLELRYIYEFIYHSEYELAYDDMVHVFKNLHLEIPNDLIVAGQMLGLPLK